MREWKDISNKRKEEIYVLQHVIKLIQSIYPNQDRIDILISFRNINEVMKLQFSEHIKTNFSRIMLPITDNINSIITDRGNILATVFDNKFNKTLRIMQEI